MNDTNIFLEMTKLKDLPPSERQVIEYVLNNPQKVCNMSIVELGVNTFTSASTVSRVCNKLNTGGFPEFKQRLCTDITHYQEYLYLNTNRIPMNTSDTTEDTIDKIISNSSKALRDVKLLNSTEKFDKVLEKLKSARKITLYGSGVSNLICHDAMIKGLRMGLDVNTFSYYSEMSIHARLSKPEDLGIIVSYTGLTVEMLKIARILKLTGCYFISITSNSPSEIVDLSDISLFVGNSESYYRIGGVESRMSM